MSIDKADRNRIADAIEEYLRCEIDNFQLDNILFTIEDRAASEIAQEVWFFYDDCKRHKNEESHKLPEPAEALLRRWVLLLRSDYEWPANEPNSRNKWYNPSRWRGVLKPIGCILGLIVLPIVFFEVIVLGRPRPRFKKNEYWPLQSLEDWTKLASVTSGHPDAADEP